MPTPFDIQNALRTVFYHWVNPPKKVGTVDLAPPLTGGKIPQGLAYSKVIFGGDEYWETSPAVLGSAGRNTSGASGADNLAHSVESFRHHHQLYGVVIGAENREKNKAITDKNGTELHKYPVLG